MSFVKKKDMTAFLALGLQFTSRIIVLPLAIIFGGLYAQEKYGVGDGVMLACVLTAAALMPLSLYSFAKEASDISKRQKRPAGEENHEDHKNSSDS